MLHKTRDQFNDYMNGLGNYLGYGRTAIGEQMAYSPTAQQTAYQTASEKAAFLKEINHIPVSAQIGQRVGVGVSRPIASRVDTDVEDRKTRDVSELTGDTYHCKQTNFDIHISYRTLDSWAHMADFGRIYSSNIALQHARDRLMIGFNGTRAEDKTSLEANPLLQDVNVGWSEKVRLAEPKRIMGYDSAGEVTDDVYHLGEGGHYRTLDALVFDMIVNLLDAWHHGADDLIVLVGRDIWTNHGMTLLSNTGMPTERAAMQSWFAAQTVAGLPCVMPPFIPSRAVIVTSYSNLSIYYHMGTMRRVVLDSPKRDRVEEYRSQNEAYVVEDFGKFASVRNGAILLPTPAGDWN